MLCEKCKNRVGAYVVSIGKCRLCGSQTYSGSSPAPILCKECSEDAGLCEICGAIRLRNLEKGDIMTDIEWAMVHYDGNNDEPYADLIVDALRQKRETDILAEEYGIDTKTMLALARSQIETTKFNIELSQELEDAIEDLHYYLDNNEENGVVFVPRFVIEKIINQQKRDLYEDS